MQDKTNNIKGANTFWHCHSLSEFLRHPIPVKCRGIHSSSHGVYSGLTLFIFFQCEKGSCIKQMLSVTLPYFGEKLLKKIQITKCNIHILLKNNMIKDKQNTQSET